MSLSRILVAVDLSPATRAVVDLATTIARSQGGAVRLCHVVQPRDVVLPGPVVTSVILSEREDAEWHIGQLVDELRASGLSVSAALLEGDPALAILDEAERWRSDAIVLGTHGRHGVRRLALGSVAESVLRRARCPVMVVPPSVTSVAEGARHPPL